MVGAGVPGVGRRFRPARPAERAARSARWRRCRSACWRPVRHAGPARSTTQAHGIDPRPVRAAPSAASVSRRTSFDPPTADLAFVAAMLDYLIERAVTWLRFHDRRVPRPYRHHPLRRLREPRSATKPSAARSDRDNGVEGSGTRPLRAGCISAGCRCGWWGWSYAGGGRLTGSQRCSSIRPSGAGRHG